MSSGQGVFSVDRQGNLLAGDKQIANFAPQVVCGYRKAQREGIGPLAALRINFRIVGQTEEQSTIIMFQDLNSFDFETNFPGCICSDSNGKSTKKRVVQYIREQIIKCASSIGRGIYYDGTGWYGKQFVTGRTVIGADMTYTVSPSIEGISLASDPAMTSCEAAEALFSALRRMPDVGLSTFAFTLFSSLRSVLREESLPTACLLYLVGEQGFGKTTLAKSYCSLYNGADKKPVDAFEAHSTDSAMRDALADARDRTVLFDDVCKSTDPSTQRKRRNTAANLGRDATSEIPAIRKSGKAREPVVCNASLVVTGEFPLETPSDLTRCVVVEVKKRLTGGTARDRIIAASALEGFLQWFSEHYDQERARLRIEYNNFRSEDRSHQEERLQISLWELSWAMSSFLRFALEVGAISTQAAAQIDTALTSELHRIFASTLQRVQNLSERSLMSLSNIIAVGAKNRRFPCFSHNGCLCVKSKELTKYLKQVTQRPDLQVNDVTAALRQLNLLRCDRSGKSSRKVNGIRELTIPFDKLGLS